MAASPARFTFDLDLAGRIRDRATPKPDPHRAEELGAARAEGYEQGFAEGGRTAEAAAAAALARAAEAMAGRAGELLADKETSHAEALADAGSLAAAIARKLAANLLAREPAGEIEALIAECLASLDAVPHLVIRCHPELAGRIREIAEAHIARSGYAGRLVVLGEDGIGFTDGRIEWADGGLIRDMNAISAEIDRRIAAYLAARNASPKGAEP